MSLWITEWTQVERESSVQWGRESRELRASDPEPWSEWLHWQHSLWLNIRGLKHKNKTLIHCSLVQVLVLPLPLIDTHCIFIDEMIHLRFHSKSSRGWGRRMGWVTKIGHLLKLSTLGDDGCLGFLITSALLCVCLTNPPRGHAPAPQVLSTGRALSETPAAGTRTACLPALSISPVNWKRLSKAGPGGPPVNSRADTSSHWQPFPLTVFCVVP